MSEFLDTLGKLLEPMRRQIGGMVSRVVVRAVDNAPGRQELQVEGFDGELHPKVEHFQPFGVRGFPPTDVDGIGLAVGGYRNHLVVLAVAPKVAGLPQIVAGDVIYHGTNPDCWTHVTADGSWRGQGVDSWYATLKGLETYQYIQMVPGLTTIRVEDPATHKYSLIEITPLAVTINGHVTPGLG